MRRAVVGILFALSVVGCSVVDRLGPPAPTEPGSAEIGVRYRYNLQTHCGLNTWPIVFDGSEWWIDGPTGYPNAPAGFSNPVDEGSIMLDGEDTGTYRSSAGTERRISRADPLQPRPSYVNGCI